MIRFFLIFLLILCQYSNCIAQFFDDFSDGNLNSNPVWEGDVDNFIVNSSQKLQLNASQSGTSKLYSKVSFADSINWEFDFLLNFAPSDNNKLRIYLAVDNPDLNNTNGYYIEVGENGNNDAINFYRLDSGISELLATSQLGSLATEPAYGSLKISYFPEGLWTFNTSYSQGAPLVEEFSLLHNENTLSEEHYFLIECIYSATRIDKFIFDNIKVSKYELDKTGPEIVKVDVLDSKTLKVQFNELLGSSSSVQKSNYTIANYSGEIAALTLTNDGSAVILTLSDDLIGGKRYTIAISNVTDLFQNTNIPKTIEFYLVEVPGPGDLIVNEILFNPETDGYDFVEILNISSKFISLHNISLSNASKDEARSISSDNFILEPGKYLCLTEDSEYQIQQYLTPDTSNYLHMDMPSFNNETGNVSLINEATSQVIDAFDYDENFHFQELDDLNGVSLERINPFSETQSENNWFSASASVNFATPGYRNSNFLNPLFSESETIEFENKTFSPDQDGLDDYLVIKYKLPSNGYLADMKVYDQGGRLIQTLLNNELIANQGIVLWDGVNLEGAISNIGIYFVVFDAFNKDGNVITAKKPAILAHYLD